MPDAESQPSEPNETLEPEVAGVLRFELSGLALGPDYPATSISAEIGRVAIAAARVDQEYALLLSGLHAGDRAHWDFNDVRRRSSALLRDKSVDRVKELFEGNCSIMPTLSCRPLTPLSTTGTWRCTACGP